MERQLQQMVRLIDDLLDLSRISRGKVELRQEPVELAVVLQNALETSRPLIAQSGHHLTVTVPPEPMAVNGDVTRLAQVFANLLNNAAKYTNRGGRIWLTAERHAHDAVITVRDDGVGIPAPMLPRVFEMFTQVDRRLDRDHAGGLGIGLSIVKRLVEMHGGTVEARSGGRGQGSDFIVRLPIVDATPDVQPGADRGRQAIEPARRRILVADDNVDAAASLAVMLEIMGNEVRTARDGLEAVAVAAAFRPDVVVLDIGMPELDGYEACRRIRAQARGRDAVFIALTGWGHDDDRRRSQEAGFDYHLVKPVEPAMLDAVLARLPAQTLSSKPAGA